MLSTSDHSRDSAGMTYVYPVVSRRAGGVSVGINLNVNNACNWACAYCQVENLVRGGPPPVDVKRLAVELESFLASVLEGDFMARCVPADFRRLVDVAFSGNGEPTSASGFPDIVRQVRAILTSRQLLPALRIRLITNGSFLHRPAVQEGIREIGDAGGEVWFKVDRVGEAASRVVNGIPLEPAAMLRRLKTCVALAPTWVQTCWFALDGEAPSQTEADAYCDFLAAVGGGITGVHLYGLARPSLQPEAGRLGRLESGRLEAFAQHIESKTGIRVLVSP